MNTKQSNPLITQIYLKLKALTLLLGLSFGCFAQEPPIKIEGYLIDGKTGNKLTDILVVNKKSGELVYGEEQGDFLFYMKKNDVFILSAQGYASTLFSLKDSVQKESYFITPALNRYQILIAPVQVTAQRELEEITNELRTLFIESKYLATDGLAPASSPISFLYSKYNKREKRKREVARLKNATHQRILFKELFRKYMNYDTTLTLTTEELDNFIYHLDISNNSINYSSNYELIVYVKRAYQQWKKTTE